MARIHAERARRLVGLPFRPQGRDPRFGLDCIGLVLEAHQIPPEEVRRDYRLGDGRRAELEAGLRRFFRKVVSAEARPGDVLLLAVSAEQRHLAVRTRDGFVHADARLRRVVETPGEPRWAIVDVYRRRSKAKA